MWYFSRIQVGNDNSTPHVIVHISEATILWTLLIVAFLKTNPSLGYSYLGVFAIDILFQGAIYAVDRTSAMRLGWSSIRSVLSIGLAIFGFIFYYRTNATKLMSGWIRYLRH